MKKHLIPSIIYIAVMLLASCKKESFLNRYPLSSISPEKFFTTETDLQLYCNQYYTNLPVQGLVNNSDFTYHDNADDKANLSISSFLSGNYTIPSSASGTKWDYTFVRTLNFFLANYQKAQTSDSVKNLYVGETFFFRANDYFGKVKAYGDVPYINTYITDTSTSMLYGPRVPHQQVMDSVLSDINFAVAHLPSPSAAADGRLNKYQALALKARICLWEGTYRKYFGTGNATSYLQAAADAAEEVINSGLYQVYTTGNPQSDYYNLFIQDELKGNPEAIMPMRYLATILTNNNDRILGESGDGYSKSFVRSYLCTDGLPTSLSPLYKGDDSLDEEIINRDPRFKQSIATRGFDLLNGDVITLPRIGTSTTSTGYMPIKGRSSDIKYWNANQSTLDFFIFRYAETLLIDAEARAELGTCDQGVVDRTINKLRDRVAMPHMIISNLVKDPKSLFPNIPVLIDEIRRERRIELASEGFRFDDLHRWNAGSLMSNPEAILGMKLLPALKAQYPPSQVSTIVVNSDNYIRVYPSYSKFPWDDKMYVYPIPVQEITLNPQISQNQGW